MKKKIQWKACPNCGCFQFTENSYEFCTQGHVNVKGDGSVDYDSADCVEITGLESQRVSYTCMACKKEYKVENGQFVEVKT